jgi:hypothetical protein
VLIRVGRRPVRDRRSAIARAVAAVTIPSHAAGHWAYLDAYRTGDWWTCVLDDRVCIRLVKVHATTGAAAIVLTSPLPTRQPDPQHPNGSTRSQTNRSRQP